MFKFWPTKHRARRPHVLPHTSRYTHGYAPWSDLAHIISKRSPFIIMAFLWACGVERPHFSFGHSVRQLISRDTPCCGLCVEVQSRGRGSIVFALPTNTLPRKIQSGFNQTGNSRSFFFLVDGHTTQSKNQCQVPLQWSVSANSRIGAYRYYDWCHCELINSFSGSGQRPRK